MVIPLPAMTTASTAYAGPLLAQRLTDFTAIVTSMQSAMTPEWRAKLTAMSPLAWTGRICERAASVPFQPLTTALDAASALILRAGWNPLQLRSAMEEAGVLDTLAIGPDISRDDPAWSALLSSEARNWYDEATFLDAMLEVAVWAFRAWALTLPSPQGAVIPFRAA